MWTLLLSGVSPPTSKRYTLQMHGFAPGISELALCSFLSGQWVGTGTIAGLLSEADQIPRPLACKTKESAVSLKRAMVLIRFSVFPCVKIQILDAGM